MQLGFEFHHSKPDSVTMTRWLPEGEASTLPIYATHNIGMRGDVCPWLDCAAIGWILFDRRWWFRHQWQKRGTACAGEMASGDEDRSLETAWGCSWPRYNNVCIYVCVCVDVYSCIVCMCNLNIVVLRRCTIVLVVLDCCMVLYVIKIADLTM